MPPPGQGRWCEQHKRWECARQRKSGRGTCHGSSVAGSNACRMHLGAKAGLVIAEVRLSGQVARELARLDVTPVTDPLTELARVAAQAVAWKDAMGAKVNELTAIRYSTETGEQLRAEIALWERALDRCVSTLTAMVRLNIEGRMAAVREATAAMLEQALTQALAASGCDLGGQARAREEFRRRLRIAG